MTTELLLIGVDGGGTKTAARVASVGDDGSITVLGEGHAGPSNVRAVGAVHATTNLGVAVDAALAQAGAVGAHVDSAVLALAGSSLPDVQVTIRHWANERQLARDVTIVHDAEPVLAAGIRGAVGVGLIVGTGSVAIGRSASGAEAVVGGWGHWFGDQGSGFDIGRRALAAVAATVDGIGPETVLIEQLLQRLPVSDPREISRHLSGAVDVRREIAALAPVVLRAAAAGDQVSADIVDAAAQATSELVAATLRKLSLGTSTPLALAGGIACSGETFRQRLLAQLTSRGIDPQPVTLVSHPVEGSIMIARDRLQGR